ncbi:Pkinase-domain-containing protein, partial [Metschnikowia bicuspidata]
NQGGDYHDVATQIYEEEKAERARASKYPGLENYEILEKMGEGAFSVVFKARHLISSKIVAIKVLRKFQMDHSQKQAALKEVTIMRQLKHPNIIRFIEVIESESYYYIVQELAVGGEIFAAIVNFTYLSEDLSRHIIYQVAEAVRYLHEEVGVVHRDIKPENLLFQPITFRPSLNPLSKLRRSDDLETKKDEGDFVPGIGGGTIGVVKLADFGLSKQIWEHNTKTPCGTVGYTAPEIVLDKRYSKEVDMWAIGCVLYTLLCGFPPFYDERIESLTEKVAHGNYTFLAPWWDEISDGAKNCVLKLLTVDPKKRYTINDLLGDPWLSKAKKPIAAILEQAKSENGLSCANFAAYQNEALFSPAALAFREAFDISAAVHRAGEEAAFQKVNVPDVVMEECDDTDTTTISNTVRDMNNDSGFALNLGVASILERRKNKPV